MEVSSIPGINSWQIICCRISREIVCRIRDTSGRSRSLNQDHKPEIKFFNQGVNFCEMKDFHAREKAGVVCAPLKTYTHTRLQTYPTFEARAQFPRVQKSVDHCCKSLFWFTCGIDNKVNCLKICEYIYTHTHHNGFHCYSIVDFFY